MEVDLPTRSQTTKYRKESGIAGGARLMKIQELLLASVERTHFLCTVFSVPLKKMGSFIWLVFLFF